MTPSLPFQDPSLAAAVPGRARAAVAVLGTPLGVAFLESMNGLVRTILGYAEEGGRFVFGNLVSDPWRA